MNREINKQEFEDEQVRGELQLDVEDVDEVRRAVIWGEVLGRKY